MWKVIGEDCREKHKKISQEDTKNRKLRQQGHKGPRRLFTEDNEGNEGVREQWARRKIIQFVLRLLRYRSAELRSMPSVEKSSCALKFL